MPTFSVYYENFSNQIKTWILYKLKQLKCESNNVRILYSEDTEKDTKKIFEDTEFAACMLHWTEFIWCESPVLVCFHSSGDEKWKLSNIVSRAQYQVSNWLNTKVYFSTINFTVVSSEQRSINYWRTREFPIDKC